MKQETRKKCTIDYNMLVTVSQMFISTKYLSHLAKKKKCFSVSKNGTDIKEYSQGQKYLSYSEKQVISK